MKTHWTERSIKDYLFQIGFDFIAQLDRKLKEGKTSRDEFAEKLELTKGRISQIFNHPGNLSLSKIIEYSRALGMKVSIVAYEDDDPNNISGPINSEVFRISWEKQGKPKDFWAFQEETSKTVSAYASTWRKGYVPVGLYNQALDQLFTEGTTDQSRIKYLKDNNILEEISKEAKTSSTSDIGSDPILKQYYDEVAGNIPTI